MELDSLSLAYCYGCRNAGDFAISQGTLALLDRTIPDTEVTGVARFDEGSEEYAEIERKLGSFTDDDHLVGGPITYDPKSQSRP